jgi:uncharacterized protein YabN with tetrapyrrole methylase and pyrophosphatase domain
MKKTQKLMKKMINNKTMIIKTNQTVKLFTNVIKKFQHVMEEQFIKSPLFQLVPYSNVDELTHNDIPKIPTKFFMIHDFKTSFNIIIS